MYLRLTLQRSKHLIPYVLETYQEMPRAIKVRFTLQLFRFLSSHVPSARFMPNPLSAGHLHLNFSSHPSSPSHDPFYLFRPSLFNHAVIGVSAYSSTHTPDTALEELENIIADFSSEDLALPFSKMCFMFQNEDSTTGGLSESPPGVVIIPSVMGNKKLYIGTLLADLCSQILGEFGRVVCFLLQIQKAKFHCTIRFKFWKRLPGTNISMRRSFQRLLLAQICQALLNRTHISAHPHILHTLISPN